MFTDLNTYRSLIYRLLLAGYIFGALQSPVYEVMHFACHIMSGTEFKVHSYNSHNDFHNHQTLDLISNSDDSPAPVFPFVENDLKKKAEILSLSAFNAPEKSFTAQEKIWESDHYNSQLVEIPHEPPRNS